MTRETKFTTKLYREFLHDTNDQLCNIVDNTHTLDVSDGIEVLRLMLEIMKELMLVDMGYYDQRGMKNDRHTEAEMQDDI